MQYDEFLRRVQEMAGLDAGAGERAMRATLATLGEGLYRTEQEALESELPSDVRSMLSERDEPEANRQRVERVRLETFYNRVSARAEVGYPQAVRQARAVMAVLRAAVGDGTWQIIRAQFPPEYEDLFAPSDLDRQTVRVSPRSTERG
jgi:uncharacterized protein (DUF2267 family)